MTCTAGHVFRSEDREHMVYFEVLAFAMIVNFYEISFCISSTRHEKLVSINRFISSFPFVCHLVVILLYSADLRI